MGDVQEILGLGSPSPAKPKQSPGPPPSVNEKKRKRPTGLSREVLQLREGQQHLVPLMPTVVSSVHSKGGFKEKRKLGARRVDKWVHREFKSSAREDGAVFSHWIKEKDKSTDYSFAKFNKKAKVPAYTPEEYEQYFKSDSWTKEDTDYLFEMCKRFDLRFLVMADRWPEDKTPRDVEALKERYYTITRKLLELHRAPGEDINQHPLIKFPYLADQDRERKRQHDHFYTRTPEEIKEEENLMIEFARLDKASKKHAQDSQRLLKIVNKRRAKEVQLQAAVEKAGSVAGTFQRPSKLYTQPVLPAHKQQKYQPHMQALLSELGVESRPSTGIAALAMAELRNDCILFFEMQRLNAEMEYQLMTLQEQTKLLPPVDEAAMAAADAAKAAAHASAAAAAATAQATATASSSTVAIASSSSVAVASSGGQSELLGKDVLSDDDQMDVHGMKDEFEGLTSRRSFVTDVDDDAMDTGGAAGGAASDDDDDAMGVDL